MSNTSIGQGDSGLGGGSWADEVSDLPTDVDYERSASQPTRSTNTGEPAAPKVERPLIPLPDYPPFTARFMNLDYRTTEEAFKGLFDSSFKIIDIKLPLDIETNKSRGFAFVDFEDRASLEKATHLDGTNFEGRNLRVLVAEQRQQRGGFQRREVPDDGKDRDFDNWERRGPLPPLERKEDTRNNEGGYRSNAPRPDNRNYDASFRSSGRPEERNYEGGYRSNRPPPPEDSRDYDNWEHRGPPPTTEEQPRNDKFRGPRRNGSKHEPTEQQKQLDSVDNWRSSETAPAPASTSPEPAKPAGRKKLVLAPRSKPLDAEAEPVRSSNLFGAAKPVDTASKLLEIEARQAKAQQERIEREEKKAAKAKEAKEAKEQLESTRKSFAALSTEEDSVQETEEAAAPRKQEKLTAAEKILAAEVPQEELEGDDWNVVVSSKRSGRR